MSARNGDNSSAEYEVAANWSLIPNSVNGMTTPAIMPEGSTSGRLTPGLAPEALAPEVSISGRSTPAFLHEVSTPARLSPSPERMSKLDARTDESEILDLITQLQQHGIQDHYDMPQIIVCGSQSAGKSSVLTAITGIPFPKARETCTKFVTQVTLQRREQPVETVEVTIKPEPKSDSARVARLTAFREYCDGSDCLTKLSSILEDAKAVIFDKADKDRLITKDIVQVTIAGPKKRPLQLFDLPGLMGVDHRGEKKDVEEIVRQYMEMPQSIILGVVRASGDLNGLESEVLDWCKKTYDPEGTRTIGVVTNPDRSDSDENAWIQVLRGEPNNFGLKNQWHVLRNPGESENIHPNQRDEWERKWFEENRWKDVPQGVRGADALFDRLCNLLFSRLRERLPALRKHLQDSLTGIESKLDKLGDTSASERIRVFRQRLEDLRKASRDHAGGTYNSDIVETFAPTEAAWLRTRVVEKGEQLRDIIVTHGHAWDSNFALKDLGPDTDLKSLGEPKALGAKKAASGFSYDGRDDEIKKWAKHLIETRGRELPGHTDPARINHIFWLMSRPWHDIAKQIVEEILVCCENYLRNMALHHFRIINRVRESTGFPNADAVAQRYVDSHVLKRLRERRLNALEELERLEEDRRDGPINYDIAFLAEQRNYASQQLFQSSLKAIHGLELEKKGPGTNGMEPEPLEARKFAQAAGRFTQKEQVNNEAVRFLRDANKHYSVSLSP